MLSVGIEGQHEDRAGDKALLLGRLRCVKNLNLIIVGIPDFSSHLHPEGWVSLSDGTSRGRWFHCQIKDFIQRRTLLPTSAPLCNSS